MFPRVPLRALQGLTSLPPGKVDRTCLIGPCLARNTRMGLATIFNSLPTVSGSPLPRASS